MVWWIVLGVVVLSLLGLAAVLMVLRGRLVELERVAALAQERAGQVQALQASAQTLPTIMKPGTR